MRHALLLTAVLSSACATTTTSPSATTTAVEAAARSGGIAFIENDLEKALAQAKAEHKPLFVDAWAPW